MFLSHYISEMINHLFLSMNLIDISKKEEIFVFFCCHLYFFARFLVSEMTKNVNNKKCRFYFLLFLLLILLLIIIIIASIVFTIKGILRYTVDLEK
jgi:hypothetical protein